MKKRVNVLATGALLGVLALVCTPAYATIEIKITDGTTSVDVLDGSALDSCPAANCVTFNGAIGDWNVNVDTGTSMGASAPNIMDLNFNGHHTASATSTTLTITLSDNGFIPASPGFTDLVNGNQTAGGTTTATLFGGNSNTKFDTTQKIGSVLTFTTATISAADGGSAATSVSPYSLTQVLTLTYGTAAGQTTGDWAVQGVPEPASVTLLGGVLLAIVSGIRRKARRA